MYPDYLIPKKTELLMWAWNNFNSRGDLLIDFSSSTGPLVSAAWMGTVLILFGIFTPHSGDFTRFLHRIAGSYFLFSLWSMVHGSFFRISAVQEISVFDTFQQDSMSFRIFFIYSTSILIIFFFGMASRYLFSKRTPREFALLVLFMHFGGLFIFRFSTFMDIFLGLEMVTLASYVLVAFERQNRFSTYAGIQYFLVGSVPSARILLGFSFFYLYGGTLVVQDLDLRLNTADIFVNNNCFNVHSTSQENSVFFATRSVTSENNFFGSVNRLDTVSISNEVSNSLEKAISQLTFFSSNDRDYLIATTIPYTSMTIRGFLFILFNLFFKITSAPFHFWAPSVYGKAPIPSMTFLSIYSKVRVFFFRYILLLGFLHFANVFILFTFLFAGLLSIFVGRIGAFLEKRIKRFFIYSSRGHVGFRLAGFSSLNKEGVFSVFHYIPIYRLSSFLRWYILLCRGPSKRYRNQFANLKREQPLLAIFFAFLLFSRSGIPPFAGFFIKLDVLSSLFDFSQFFLNYIFFFFTVASFFYYLRAIKILFFDQSLVEKVKRSVSKDFNYTTEYNQSNLLSWIRSTIFLFLLFYIFMVQKPLFLLQNERIISRFN